MKFVVFSVAALFVASTSFGQVSKQQAVEKAPEKSAVVVKQPASGTAPQKAPAKTVTPSTQKKQATPVKPAATVSKTTPVTTPKDITGFWLTANKASIIQFYKDGDRYSGKIAWQRYSKDKSGKPLTDVNNPDKSKRNNPLLGTTMISNLRYNAGSKMYEGGRIYMPQVGKTYDCKVKIASNGNSMEITAIAGLSMMSKTFTWSRTTGVPSK